MAEQEGSSPRWRTPIFVLLAFVITVSPVIAYYASLSLSFDFPTLMTVINVVASLLLSLGLIYVYTSMISIQDRQTEIQGNQESLMELQNLAAARIVSWDGDGNLLRCRVANVGPGAIASISAGIRILPQNIDYSENFHLYKKPIYQNGADGRKNFLMGEKTASFVGPAIATTVVHNVQNFEFTRVINNLCNESEDEIEFIVTIEFTDLSGDSSEISLTSRRTEIHKGMSFEQALRSSMGSHTNTVGRHWPTKTTLETIGEIDQSGMFFSPNMES